MSHTERKCFAMSAAVHGLLLAIVLLVPAFISLRTLPPPVDTPVFYPIFEGAKIIDGPTRGGGNPNAAPVQPPPQPQRQPEPQPVRREPVQPPPRQSTVPEPAKPATVEAAVPRDKPAKPDINIRVSGQLVKRDPEAPVSVPDDSAERKRKEAAAAAASKARSQRIADSIAKATRGTAQALGNSFSSGTQVDIPGPGGAAYANYSQVVQQRYYDAWLVPDNVGDKVKTVLAEVVVARNGRIVKQKVLEFSGNAALDRSVDRALDAVRERGLPGFPEESKDLQRTFKIRFDLQTKRNFG